MARQRFNRTLCIVALGFAKFAVPEQYAALATHPVLAQTLPKAGSSTLVGPYWRAIELEGQPVAVQNPKQEPHLVFHADGRVTGSDGCNQVTGAYSVKGDTIAFSQLAGTLMACTNSGDIPRAFREALKRATRVSVAANRMQLADDTGARLAVFAAAMPAGQPLADLRGTSWQLVRFEGSDGSTLTPGDRTKYTVEFSPDGRLAARIDCNRGRGTWKSSGPNQLELGPLALTRAMCPPGSLHDQIVKQWSYIRSFVIRDGHLFLALMADGGIYEFEPLAKRP